MNKRRLIGIIPAAALLLLAACTQDEPGGQGNELPYGEYPLQITGVTLDVESSAEPWSAEEPQTRVTEDNTDGKSSVWEWNGSEMIGVRLGNETATYTLNAGPSLEPDRQLYWTSTAPATVTAWYPTNETVDLRDQSKGLAYVLQAEVQGATYDNKITLEFTHQLAKVRVVLNGTQASLAQSVEVYGYTTCTNNEGAPVTDNAQQGWLKMKHTTYADGTECWEANIVPGNITLTDFIRINGQPATINNDFPTTLASGNMYTINLTVGEVITEITAENNYPISDDGYYRVSGIFNQQINITGGKPTIYLEGASINVSDGPAINITGGTPTIHVIGEGNSVSSSNNSGIAVSGGATVTIEGSSTADVLTANGSNGGAGIGSPLSGATAGNVIITNVTVNATGGGKRQPYLGGAGIGSSSSGNCGDITITDAVINANGGAFSPGIGMGYGNTSQPSIGKITITNSDVTAKAGDYASAIGLPYSEGMSGAVPDYKVGQIIITTDNLETFLSKLTAGGTANPDFAEYAQRIGKGSHGKSYTPSVLNQDGTGPWEGVVINGTAYPDGVQ